MQKTIKAKKNLGQNFLIDEEALTDIARSLDIAGRHIIEVGPGYGALTNYILSHHPATLDLVELDPDMIEILDERYMGDEVAPTILGEENILVKTTPVAIHHQDVLKYIPQYENYSVIANIPYYITSPILFHFLYPQEKNQEKVQKQEIRGKKIFSKEVYSDVNNWEINFFNDEVRSFSDFSPPKEMTIMMQEEVGEKILAGRNKKPHHSYLSLAMELACADIEIVRYVGRTSFDPAPRVDSIVLKFSVRESRDREKEEKLLRLWRIAFTHPRKTLMSNMKWSHYDIEWVKRWLTEYGYDEKIRAEAVKREDWEGFIL
jgi:16S rRNA (adenine1518-N6/adenine1519-N6)-dimethyltransferase